MLGPAVFALILFASCAVGEKEVVHLPPETVVQILQGATLCIAETGVSPDVLVQYRSGKLSDDKNFQKFIHCVLLKNGYVDKTGHIKPDKALEVFPKSADKQAIIKVMQDCNKETGENPAEVSYKFAKCFRQKAPVKIVV